MKVLAAITAIILVTILTISLTIDGIVKKGIEESASELLKTEVKIRDVDISLFNGRSEINGFAVINPEGFSSEAAISFEEMEMSVSLMSLLSDTIMVKELIVKNPQIFIEQKGSSANLKELNDNMGPGSSNEENSKKLVINYFLMEEGEIRVSTELKGKSEVKSKVSRVELENIGKAGSNTVQETIRQVLEPILRDAIANTVKDRVLDQIENTVKDLIGN